MADYKNQGNSWAGSQGEVAGQTVNQGLRTYMLRVYNLMALGVAFTAVVVLFMMNNPELMKTIAMGPMRWGLLIGVLALGWFSPRLIFSGSKALAHAAYWGYAALLGAMISPMLFSFFHTGKADLVFQAFAISSATFAAMSLFGYVTKKDLAPMGTFLVMASIGLLIAMLANALFFKLEMMSLITSGAAVLIFSAMTAWETQEIKEMYHEADEQHVEGSKAIFGAFLLYGSFVMIFIHLLNILGIMDD